MSTFIRYKDQLKLIQSIQLVKMVVNGVHRKQGETDTFIFDLIIECVRFFYPINLSGSIYSAGSFFFDV